jgi:hypothetical protein
VFLIVFLCKKTKIKHKTPPMDDNKNSLNLPS